MKKQKNKKILLIILAITLVSIVSVSAIYLPNTIFGKLIRDGGSPSFDAIETTFDFDDDISYCLAVYNCGLSGVELKIENSEDSTILVKEKFHFKSMKEGSIPSIKTGKLNQGTYKITLTPYGGENKYATIYMPFREGILGGCGTFTSCY